MVFEKLLDKYNADKDHAFQVQRLSLIIFDKAKQIGLHDMSLKKRKLLEIGSLLHDIGYFVESKGHNKHSSSLIKTEEFDGVDEEQKKMIACIARYHRGNLPGQKHSTFASLDSKKQKKVQKLSGIVRLADGLDCSHMSLVDDIELKFYPHQNILWIKVIPKHQDFRLKLSSVFYKKDLFEKSFGVQAVLISA